VRTLEAALWAFYTTDTFKAGCLAVANLGADADTTACVYGQIAGAFYGEQAIPDQWRSKMAWKDFIHSAARALATAGMLGPGSAKAFRPLPALDEQIDSTQFLQASAAATATATAATAPSPATSDSMSATPSTVPLPFGVSEEFTKVSQCLAVVEKVAQVLIRGANPGPKGSCHRILFISVQFISVQ